MQAEVAFSRNRHTQSTVAEHFDAHKRAVRTADVVADDCLVDFVNLFEVNFAGKHHHIGKLRVESHRLTVRYIHLSGNVHLHIN